MKNLSISFTLGKGLAAHGSNIQHNNRKFTAKNVDETRFTSNIIYKQQYIEDAYLQLFSKALREYNAKQKKDCRKIDDYYAHILRGRREEPFYEAIVQFGDCHSAASGTPDGERVKAMLDEYMKMFQVRNPNLYVFNAVLHDDEASPHLHIDFIPFYTHGRKIGLSKGVSMRAALQEMGFAPKNGQANHLVAWEESERKQLEEILRKHGYGHEDKDAHYPHMTVEQYKASQEAKHMTDALKKSHPVSVYDDIRELKMRLAASERRADVMAEQMQSPYVSFFYADDEKRSFVLDHIHRRNIPFRETENGFEAQQYYTEEIRQIEKQYRPSRSKRDVMRDDIDMALMQSKDFDEFLVRMENRKYEIKRGKYLAMRPEFAANFIRVKSLGEFYSEDALRNRLSAKRTYERDLEQRLRQAEETNAPNFRVLKTMRLYIVAFSKGYLPIRRKEPARVLTWKNDAELDRLTSLNEKINQGATLESLRADMAKKEKAVREIEQTIERSKISDPEVAAKLNTALRFAQQELQKAAGWVTTAEQVLGGTFIQQIGELEKQRRESDFLENGTKFAEGEDYGKSIYQPRRR